MTNPYRMECPECEGLRRENDGLKAAAKVERREGVGVDYCEPCDVARNLAPRNPRPPVEISRQPEIPQHPPRQHHSLKRIQQYHPDDGDTANNGDNVHMRLHKKRTSGVSPQASAQSRFNLDALGRLADSLDV